MSCDRIERRRCPHDSMVSHDGEPEFDHAVDDELRRSDKVRLAESRSDETTVPDLGPHGEVPRPRRRSGDRTA